MEQVGGKDAPLLDPIGHKIHPHKKTPSICFGARPPNLSWCVEDIFSQPVERVSSSWYSKKRYWDLRNIYVQYFSRYNNDAYIPSTNKIYIYLSAHFYGRIGYL